MINQYGTGERVPERLVPDSPVYDAAGALCEPGCALPIGHDLGVPTMLVQRELDYLHWLGSMQTGAGRVVELGCFLGGSTAAIVEGMRRSGAEHRPVLVYDAFVAPEDDTVVQNWGMKRYGLHAGENFRSIYESLHADRMHLIDIREVMLPSKVDAEGERAVYPEQEPVELLFVDAGKTWGVHRSILRSFGRHIRPGGVVVQQDFMDMGTPWLPLHMWQLREVFEPLDAVRATPSMSFRCNGDATGRVEQLWEPQELQDSEVRESVWSDVIDYWGGIIGTAAAGFLHGHAAKHAASCGDPEQAFIHARSYEAWANSGECRDVYVTPMWQEALQALAVLTDAREGRVLCAESRVRRSIVRSKDLDGQQGFYSADVRRRVWNRMCKKLIGDGHKQIALYGAGKHTHWVMDHVFTEQDISVVCIIDDTPAVNSIRGVAVVRPEDALRVMGETAIILPSSDAHEASLLARAQIYASGLRGVDALGVYTTMESNDDDAAVAVQSSGDILRRSSTKGLDPELIQKHAPERLLLGLPQDRDWVEAFAKMYAAPDWVNGYVNSRDSLLLWDLMEAERPVCVVEIGTASGVSTASLIAGAARFAAEGSRPVVHSFDISERCYFDDSRSVGAAVAEVVPGLAEQVYLHPRMTAADAAGMFRIGEVDFAFIDGDHRHPAPTLDLLALLYVMKPGAWIALHDIELTAVGEFVGKPEWDVVTGAERLFKQWPFEKIQPSFPDPTMNNIGAVRLPENPGELPRVVEFLLGLLNESWETHHGPSVEMKIALQALVA